MQVRCVRCEKKHLAAECGSKNEPALCDKEHPASYKEYEYASKPRKATFGIQVRSFASVARQPLIHAQAWYLKDKTLKA